MMEALEEEVNRASEAFLAAIIGAVERAVIAALRAALAGSTRAGDAPAPATEAAPRGDRAHRRAGAARRAPTPADTEALAGRIIACVGANPGSTVMHLAPHVGVHETTLRRHLHRLAHDGLIRIEEHPSVRFGGQPTRTYFIIERVEAAPPETDITRAEAA